MSELEQIKALESTDGDKGTEIREDVEEDTTHEDAEDVETAKSDASPSPNAKDEEKNFDSKDLIEEDIE